MARVVLRGLTSFAHSSVLMKVFCFGCLFLLWDFFKAWIEIAKQANKHTKQASKQSKHAKQACKASMQSKNVKQAVLFFSDFCWFCANFFKHEFKLQQQATTTRQNKHTIIASKHGKHACKQNKHSKQAQTPRHRRCVALNFSTLPGVNF